MNIITCDARGLVKGRELILCARRDRFRESAVEAEAVLGDGVSTGHRSRSPSKFTYFVNRICTFPI